MDDKIQPVEIYRGVDIQDCQPPARIEAVVKPEIDAVFAMTEVRDLVQYCDDTSKPPEARLLAVAKLKALHQIAADDRTERPNINLEYIDAATVGLDSRSWRSPWYYGSLFDRPLDPVRRPPEYQRQVEDDRDQYRDDQRRTSTLAADQQRDAGK